MNGILKLRPTKCHSELVSESHEKEFLKQVQDDKNRAFTLAEVLITLTIIGVIAAITIPNLMQKWQKKATITKLSKGYNSVIRMANNIKQNTGCDDLACTGFYNIDKSDNYAQLQKEFIRLAQIKDAKTYSTTWRLPVILSCEKSGCTDSTGYFANFFVTQDGLVYYVGWNEDNINRGLLVEVITEPSTNVIKRGDDKKTLHIGRNTFFFLINNDFKVTPYSTLKECTENTYGRGCAAKIIADGWKMNY